MTAFMMERIAQTLAANQKLRLHMQGNEFRVIASTWPLSVSFFKGGAIVGSASGVLAGDYSRGMEFDGVEIANGATAQSVVVGLSNGSAGSDRITGSVEVIDGGRSRSLAGMSFWGKVGAGPSVGEYSHVQLMNPAGSGKIAFIKKMSLFTTGGAGMTCVFGFTAAQLANLYFSQPINKKGGVGASASQNRDGQLAAITVPISMGSMILRVGTLEQYEFTEPIVLPPGTGFTVAGATLNQHLGANFEHHEESET